MKNKLNYIPCLLLAALIIFSCTSKKNYEDNSNQSYLNQNLETLKSDHQNRINSTDNFKTIEIFSDSAYETILYNADDFSLLKTNINGTNEIIFEYPENILSMSYDNINDYFTLSDSRDDTDKIIDDINYIENNKIEIIETVDGISYVKTVVFPYKIESVDDENLVGNINLSTSLLHKKLLSIDPDSNNEDQNNKACPSCVGLLILAVITVASDTNETNGENCQAAINAAQANCANRPDKCLDFSNGPCKPKCVSC